MKTLRGPDVSLHHGGAFLGVRQRPAHSLQVSDPHVTRHTSQVTRHTPHVTRHTSHATRHTSHAKRHTLHVTRHTPNATRYTSHVTRHTSHVTRHTYAADHLVNIAGISLERHVVDPRLQQRVNAGRNTGVRCEV
jgi:uncharacterized protein (DUF3084 family)